MEDDLTLGGGHTMQHTDHVPKKCTLDSYRILSTDATSIHIIKKRELYIKAFGPGGFPFIGTTRPG